MRGQGLWSRSVAWRWLLSFTCLLTALVFWLKPWFKPVVFQPTAASFKPPPGIVVSPPNANQFQAGNSAPMRFPLTGANPYANAAPPAVFVPAPGAPHDDTFNALVTAQNAFFPLGTELHMIGVYEGKIPEKTVTPSSRCRDCPPVIPRAPVFSQRQRIPVKVDVTRSGVPIVLALTAYEPVLWNISLSSRVNLQRVILAGYHGQEIEGIPNTIPVETHTYEDSECDGCTKLSDYFYSYDNTSNQYLDAVNKLKVATGLTPYSFQGSYSASHFSLSQNVVSLSEYNSSNKRNDFNQLYADKEFSSSVPLGNHSVMLPDGKWRVVAFEKIKGSPNQEQLLVLARIEHNELQELMTAVSQTAIDSHGFAAHAACMLNTGYAAKTEINETSGRQRCYWVEHVTAPWNPPILAKAAKQLDALNVAVPDTVISSGFRKADSGYSLTVLHYLNPDSKGISTPLTDWDVSPWHKDNLKNSPERLKLVKEYMQWVDSWFQLVRASN